MNLKILLDALEISDARKNLPFACAFVITVMPVTVKNSLKT
jgi:hypothetical protein